MLCIAGMSSAAGFCIVCIAAAGIRSGLTSRNVVSFRLRRHRRIASGHFPPNPKTRNTASTDEGFETTALILNGVQTNVRYRCTARLQSNVSLTFIKLTLYTVEKLSPRTCLAGRLARDREPVMVDGDLLTRLCPFRTREPTHIKLEPRSVAAVLP